MALQEQRGDGPPGAPQSAAGPAAVGQPRVNGHGWVHQHVRKRYASTPRLSVRCRLQLGRNAPVLNTCEFAVELCGG